jgi:hypothetical protein
MTDDDGPDDTPRTYDNGGGHQHSGPYRGLDPWQQDMFRRLDTLEGDAAAQRTESALAAASRRTWRWIAGFAVPVLLGGMLALVGYAVGQISTSAEHVGETKAEIRALSKLIDLLEVEVAELRRHAGIAPTPIVEGRVGVNP